MNYEVQFKGPCDTYFEPIGRFVSTDTAVWFAKKRSQENPQVKYQIVPVKECIKYEPYLEGYKI